MGLQPRVLKVGGLQIYLWICGFSPRLKVDAQSDMATCLYSSVLFDVFLCFLSSLLLPMPQRILPNVHDNSISCLNVP